MYKILTEGRVVLLDSIKETIGAVVRALSSSRLCYAMRVCLKAYAISTISKHHELSVDKVRYIAEIVTKDEE